MISIVDYGLGNILAFVNIYKRLNIEVSIASSPQQLEKADKVILPGVGAFDWAMTRLNESGLREILDKLVLETQKPVIGICVGMQMMANRSEEGEMEGLKWINAEVKRFNDDSFTHSIHLPHMGWNSVVPVKEDPLFRVLKMMHVSIFYIPIILATEIISKFLHKLIMVVYLLQLHILGISMVFSFTRRKVIIMAFSFSKFCRIIRACASLSYYSMFTYQEWWTC